MKSLTQLIKESIIDESCNASKGKKIARINSKTGYYKNINESNVNIELDWTKSNERIDYETKKLVSAITDKYRNLLNRGSNPSFSDVAYDYLSDNGYDEDEATDLSYELEDIFNQVSLIRESKTEKDVPYENLNTADEVITYAKTLSDFTFKDEESGLGKNGLKAFSLTNKNGLKIIVDFFNDSEYICDFEDKDGNSLYRMPSTRNNHETNWKDKLNPKTWSRKMISATESRISKYNANAKRAKNRYDHFGKSSDYNKYLQEKTWAQRESRSLEKIKKIAELS